VRNAERPRGVAEALDADSIAEPALASASRNVKLFIGSVNAWSNACWLMLTSPSSGSAAGGA